MKRWSRKAVWTSVVGLSFLAGAARAEVRLPAIFSDGMVLQRQMAVPVWGWAAPGETVIVRFGDQQRTAAADADGKWMVRLDPMPADKTGREMTIAGTNKLTFKDVLVGEVWVCSGQSNMEMTVEQCLNFAAEKEAANQPLIREIKFPHVCAATPQTDIHGRWVQCSPATVGAFTGAGYFFARELVRELDVPVGIVNDCWGGTRIEPWIPPFGFEMVEQLKALAIDSRGAGSPPRDGAPPEYLAKAAAYVGQVKEWLPKAEAAVAAHQAPDPLAGFPVWEDRGVPVQLYNGMIHPIIPYAMRGALWYQGESNEGAESAIYGYKMLALIGGWRKAWGEGDFPFYFVQLSTYSRSDPRKPQGGDSMARLRESQMRALTLPNTGMACAIDIGEEEVHAKNKQDVGKRLALWALAKTYHKEGVVFSGPMFKSQTVEGNKIRVSFDDVGGGLMLGRKQGIEPVQPEAGGKLTWAAIAGEDHVWWPADAVIDGPTVVFSSEKVAKPVAVQYAFARNPQGPNLYNKEGLPAVPFRTDNW